MLVLNNTDIAQLLSFQEVIEAVETALIDNEKKKCFAPQRLHFDREENTFLVMPSFSESHFGTKLVSVVPDNSTKQLPVTNGVMILNDAKTGMPLAIFNAAKLTALRTGALGAIGIKYMTPPNVSSIGLIGCGVQGIHQALFACSVRQIEIIYCLERTPESVQKLAFEINHFFPNVTIVPCKTAEEILSLTDVIVAASRSAEPVLPDNPDMLQGKHFISIGSYKPDMQELPDSVFRLAGKLAIDSDGARKEVGDIINPIKKGLITEENVFTLGKVLTNEQQINVNQTTVYKSAGMALFDLFVAQEMYKAAVAKKAGQLIQL
ncbi:ornithine cyclodeaminase family protein [Solitalea lacus]|uniref:ornithine cyclodeaminase family protein n=1 Tax=Solitalea lacus TaxID=2911172 RepID=UPI001ED9FD3D|nr:hypothetical protein [Solitalea lacus]UKJ09160.1 hypothetical protein L2B55_08380 [Solitalea lacus]